MDNKREYWTSNHLKCMHKIHQKKKKKNNMKSERRCVCRRSFVNLDYCKFIDSIIDFIFFLEYL